MVPDSGKTLRTGTVKPVNIPEPLKVETGTDGLPVTVITNRRQQIAAIEDRWRIDDEWWRSEPVTRLYYTIVLTSGQRLTIYQDLTAGSWYRQGY